VGDQVQVGVVGVAGMGLAHLFAVSGLAEEYRLAGVCDVDGDACRRAATDFGAEAYPSLDELLDADVAEAVVLAVPPFHHAAMTHRCLAAGLHVYCEKPLAPTVRECDELAAASVGADRVVQVGCQHRFQRSYVAAKELLAEGAIGEVFRASLVATNWFRPQAYFDARPWRGAWASVGGGVLLSQAIHQVDAFLWLVGLPTSVTAEAWRTLHSVEVEDEVTAIMRLANGGRGTLVASTVDPVGTDRIELHGDAGTLVLDGFGLRVGRFDGPATRLCAESPDEFPKVAVEWEDRVVAKQDGNEWYDLVVDCHRDFVAAIRGHRAPRTPPAEAANAVELANAAYLSAVRGRPVDLPLDRDAYDEVYADLCDGRAVVSQIGNTPA
jgi:predicted dehydrogenase